MAGAGRTADDRGRVVTARPKLDVVEDPPPEHHLLVPWVDRCGPGPGVDHTAELGPTGIGFQVGSGVGAVEEAHVVATRSIVDVEHAADLEPLPVGDGEGNGRVGHSEGAAPVHPGKSEALCGAVEHQFVALGAGPGDEVGDELARRRIPVVQSDIGPQVEVPCDVEGGRGRGGDVHPGGPGESQVAVAGPAGRVDGYGCLVGVGPAAPVAHPKGRRVGSRGDVGELRGRPRGVVEGAVTVEVPVVSQRVAVGVGGAGTAEVHHERGGARGGVGGQCRRRCGVLRVNGVSISDDPAAKVVDGEQVAARTDLETHRAHLAGEQFDRGRVGNAPASGVHHPDALA